MTSPIRTNAKTLEHLAHIPSTDGIQKSLASMFTKINGIHFSTMPILFEFISHLRQNKLLNNWSSELDKFKLPKILETVEKYHASSGALLTALSAEQVAQEGHQENSKMFFESRPLSPLFNLTLVKSPLKNNPQLKWEEAKTALHNKSGILWVYGSKDKEGSVIVIRPNFNGTDMIEEYASWKEFETKFTRYNSGEMELTDDAWPFLRTLVRSTLVHTIESRTTHDVLKINLVSGTLEVDQSSFSLIDLVEHPDQEVEFWIEGQKSTLKGHEAYKVLFENYAKNFNLPSDYADNLWFLLSHRNQYFDEILLKPAATLKDVWPDYENTEKEHAISQTLVQKTKANDKTKKQKEKADHTFDQAIQLIFKNDAVQAKEELKSALNQYQTLNDHIASIHNVPVDVLLE